MHSPKKAIRPTVEARKPRINRRVIGPSDLAKKENMPDIPVEIHVGPAPINYPVGQQRLPVGISSGKPVQSVNNVSTDFFD